LEKREGGCGPNARVTRYPQRHRRSAKKKEVQIGGEEREGLPNSTSVAILGEEVMKRGRVTDAFPLGGKEREVDDYKKEGRKRLPWLGS